jgi:hypothetical protein
LLRLEDYASMVPLAIGMVPMMGIIMGLFQNLVEDGRQKNYQQPDYY